MNFVDLSNTDLFEGISETELPPLIACLQGQIKSYQKNETLLSVGESTDALGVVVHGAVQIERFDVWGNRSIVAKILAGDIFAETFACIPSVVLNVSVTAAEDCEIIYLKAGIILSACPSACAFHKRLAENLLRISAKKNYYLGLKIHFLSQKTIRARLEEYFAEQQIVHKSKTFRIPFDRQSLSDYLSVDRCALCSELSRMRKEGLIEYRKNEFKLLYCAESAYVGSV